MNGYGQLNYNDSLINALAQQRALEQQQNAIQQGMAGNNGWTGGAGILGQALLGLAAGKKAKQQQSLDAEIQKQIAQMQAGAEQQARDLEAKQLAEQRAYQESQAQVKRQQQLDDEARRRAYQVEDRNFQYSQPQKPSWQQQQFNSLSSEQQQQARMNMFGLNKPDAESIYSPTQKAIIQANPELKEKIDEQIINKETGVKEPSDSIKQKLSFLRNAREKLDKYKSEAFDESGDFQETSHMAGNTKNLLVEAVRNKLRAESGASISDQEALSESDLFMPSVFSRDKTNLSKVKELEDTLDRLEKELNGRGSSRDIKQQQYNANTKKYLGQYGNLNAPIR